MSKKRNQVQIITIHIPVIDIDPRDATGFEDHYMNNRIEAKNLTAKQRRGVNLVLRGMRETNTLTDNDAYVNDRSKVLRRLFELVADALDSPPKISAEIDTTK